MLIFAESHGWQCDCFIAFGFWQFLSVAEDRHWQPRFTENMPVNAFILTLNVIIHFMLKRVVQSLNIRATSMCQECWDLLNESDNIRNSLPSVSVSSGLSISFLWIPWEKVLKKLSKPLGSVFLPHVKGISGKFKHIRNHYNIRIQVKSGEMSVKYNTSSTFLLLLSWNLKFVGIF